MAGTRPLRDGQGVAEPDAPARAATIVVRLWKDAEREGFRARVTCVPDVSDPREDVRVVDSPDAVLALVRQCLEKFAGH